MIDPVQKPWCKVAD